MQRLDITFNEAEKIALGWILDASVVPTLTTDIQYTLNEKDRKKWQRKDL